MQTDCPERIARSLTDAMLPPPGAVITERSFAWPHAPLDAKGLANDGLDNSSEWVCRGAPKFSRSARTKTDHTGTPALSSCLRS